MNTDFVSFNLHLVSKLISHLRSYCIAVCNTACRDEFITIFFIFCLSAQRCVPVSRNSREVHVT